MKMFDRYLSYGAIRPRDERPPTTVTDAARLIELGHELGLIPPSVTDPSELSQPQVREIVGAADRQLRQNKRELAAVEARLKDAERQRLVHLRTLAESPFMGMFRVDNVADFVERGPSIVDLYDFPPVAPSRSFTWLEWKGRGEGTQGRVTVGAWVASQRGDDDWLLTIDMFAEFSKAIYGPIATATVNLNERGKADPESVQWTKELEGAQGELRIVLQSLAFLHCRNVETEPLAAPSGKLAKRHRMRHGFEPVQFQTIRLRVPRRQGGGGGGEGANDRALHVVDGHFAHYGACCDDHEPKGLLFGKYEGVYWVEAHARGNAQRGVIRSERILVPDPPAGSQDRETPE